MTTRRRPTFTFSGQQEAMLRMLLRRRIRRVSEERREPVQYMQALGAALEELAKAERPQASHDSALRLVREYRPGE